MLADINTNIQETWADRLDVRVEMNSCHYILWFICLNAHPERWSFLPGASCLPLTFCCSVVINDSQHHWLFQQLTWSIVFRFFFKGHFQQNWMWIIRRENDRYMSSWGVYIRVKAAWATDKVRRSTDSAFLVFSSSPLRRWTIAQSKSLIPSPQRAPQVRYK